MTTNSATHVSVDRNVRLRSVAEGDLATLEILDKEVFKDVAYSMVYLKSLFVLFNKTWLVAEYDDELAGYALVCPNSDNTEAWLMGLAVSERYQGKGLGRQLMEGAMELMRDAKVSDAYITVRPDNKAAYHLYQKFGFIQQGDERPDYYGTGEPRKVLHRSLAKKPYRASPGRGTRRRLTSRLFQRSSR
ncbi:GNAT family N-acetyltransferase [Catenulispora rubra]|uniref:GNAT family N-acetyltransferase n=1 Tax=Catenulispora rubra TaxID=280293 RepID=UPI001892381E|nr:GNAT family N-acetyltransferase [Catenulispora rubra]